MAGNTSARIISEMLAGQEELLGWLKGLDPQKLHRQPAPGEWTVMENLAHIIEMVPYWARQIRSVVDQPGRTFGRTHDNPERIAAIEQHATDSLEEAMRLIQASFLEACRILETIPDEGWSAVGVHPRWGELSMEKVARRTLTSHLQEHVTQAKAAYEAVKAQE